MVLLLTIREVTEPPSFSMMEARLSYVHYFALLQLLHGASFPPFASIQTKILGSKIRFIFPRLKAWLRSMRRLRPLTARSQEISVRAIRHGLRACRPGPYANVRARQETACNEAIRRPQGTLEGARVSGPPFGGLGPAVTGPPQIKTRTKKMNRGC